LNEFIEDCFDKDGEIKVKEYTKNPSKTSCGYCPFKDDKKLCQENSCDDLYIETGKDFSSKKCSSANKDACNRDNNSNIGFEFKIK
jgi:hypothetical protein